MGRRGGGNSDTRFDPLSPEWRELYEYEMRTRREHLEDEIAALVEVAASYAEELQRDDPAHKARLARQRDSLLEHVKFCYEALRPGPVTRRDLEMAKRLKEWAERSEAEREAKETKRRAVPPPPNVVKFPKSD